MAVLAARGEGSKPGGSAPAMMEETEEVRVVFDRPPGRDMPTLIEVEDQSGRTVDVGQWRARPDGYWELVIPLRQS